MTIRILRPFLAMALALAVALSAFSAPDYPVKPVRLIVPFPPGGATDTLARLMAEKLGEKWHQPVIVENKPGANTSLGTDVVAKSAPDGHTLGIVTGSHVINPLLTSKLPYDTLRDLTGVMMLTRFHMGIYAHPSFPANTPSELISLARQAGTAPAYAAATTQSYLGMSLLNTMAGSRMDYVPYKGSAQAINDLLGGHVKLMIDPILHSTLQHVQNGKLKLIGTMGAKPAELTPGVPVFGPVVKGFDFSGVFGMVVRSGTPAELIQKIRNDLAAVMNLPEVADRVRLIGQEAIVSTPEEYNAYILEEMKKWEPVIKATGARLD